MPDPEGPEGRDDLAACGLARGTEARRLLERVLGEETADPADPSPVDLGARLVALGVDDRQLVQVGHLLAEAADRAKQLEDAGRAVRLLTHATAVFGLAGARLPGAWASYVRGGQLRSLGCYEPAVEAFVDAQLAFEEQGLVERVADCRYQIGATWHLAGEIALSETPLRAALEVFQRSGQVDDEAYCHSLLARVETDRQAWDLAADHAGRAVAAFTEAGDVGHTAGAHFTYGVALRAADRDDEAAEQFATALRLGDRAGDLRLVAACHYLLGETCFGHGDYDGARAAWIEALRVYRVAGDDEEIAACTDALGRLPG